MLGIEVRHISYLDALTPDRRQRFPMLRNSTRYHTPQEDRWDLVDEEESHDSCATNSSSSSRTTRLNKTSFPQQYTTRKAKARNTLAATTDRLFSKLIPTTDLVQYQVSLKIPEGTRQWCRWIEGSFSYFRYFSDKKGYGRSRAILYSILEMLADRHSKALFPLHSSPATDDPNIVGRESDMVDLQARKLLQIIAAQGYVQNCGIFDSSILPLVSWFQEGYLRYSLPQLFNPSNKAFTRVLHVFSQLLRSPTLRSSLLELFPCLRILNIREALEWCCSDSRGHMEGNAHCVAGTTTSTGHQITLVNLGADSQGEYIRLYTKHDPYLGEGTRPVGLPAWQTHDLAQVRQGGSRRSRLTLVKVLSLQEGEATHQSCDTAGSLKNDHLPRTSDLAQLLPPSRGVADYVTRGIESTVNIIKKEVRIHLTWDEVSREQRLILHKYEEDSWYSFATTLCRDQVICEEGGTLPPLTASPCIYCKNSSEVHTCPACQLQETPVNTSFHAECGTTSDTDTPFGAEVIALCSACSTKIILRNTQEGWLGEIPECSKLSISAAFGTIRIGEPTKGTVDEILIYFSTNREITDKAFSDHFDTLDRMAHDLSDIPPVCITCAKNDGRKIFPCYVCKAFRHQKCWAPKSFTFVNLRDTQPLCCHCTAEFIKQVQSATAPDRHEERPRYPLHYERYMRYIHDPPNADILSFRQIGLSARSFSPFRQLFLTFTNLRAIHAGNICGICDQRVNIDNEAVTNCFCCQQISHADCNNPRHQASRVTSLRSAAPVRRELGDCISYAPVQLICQSCTDAFMVYASSLGKVLPKHGETSLDSLLASAGTSKDILRAHGLQGIVALLPLTTLGDFASHSSALSAAEKDPRLKSKFLAAWDTLRREQASSLPASAGSASAAAPALHAEAAV